MSKGSSEITIDFLPAFLDKLATETEQEREQILVDFGKDLLTNLVLSTPVDTGRARGNWFVSMGSPSAERTDERKGERVDYAGRLSENLGYLGRNLDWRQTAYITNNLPYIQRLNEGYSAQAPLGFVDTAVQIAIQNLTKVR